MSSNDFLNEEITNEKSSKRPTWYIILTIIAGLLCLNSFLLARIIFYPASDIVYYLSLIIIPILKLSSLSIFLILLIHDFSKSKLVTLLLLILSTILTLTITVLSYMYGDGKLHSFDITGLDLAAGFIFSYILHYVLIIVTTIIFLVSYKKK